MARDDIDHTDDYDIKNDLKKLLLMILSFRNELNDSKLTHEAEKLLNKLLRGSSVHKVNIFTFECKKCMGIMDNKDRPPYCPWCGTKLIWKGI